MLEKSTLLSQMAAEPNMFAPSSGYTVSGAIITVTGYQSYSFELDSMTLNPFGSGLTAKANLVNSLMNSAFLKNKTVLDLGGNNGYFSLMSLLKGASSAAVVDIDEAAVDNVLRLSQDSSISNLHAFRSNVATFLEPSDIVYAFALIHWVFDLTTGFGSLENALIHLKSLANEALIIEWVDACDPKIVRCDHIKANDNSLVLRDYSEDNFKSILRHLFGFVVEIGSINDTRRLYLACSPSCARSNFAYVYYRKKCSNFLLSLRRIFGAYD